MRKGGARTFRRAFQCELHESLANLWKVLLTFTLFQQWNTHADQIAHLPIMGAESAVWNTTGGVLYHDIEIPQLTAKPGSPSLESRFFADDGLWREAPMLTGQVSFEPLPDVRNILVTGGEGFVASWLVRHLVTKYPQAYTVVSFDKLDYCSSRHNARMLESRPNFHFVHGDVTNDEDVVDCLKRYRIDTIFHLAAHTHVDLSFGNSKSFTKNNVLGTHVLLESAKDVGTVKRFYHISTDEVSLSLSEACESSPLSGLWRSENGTRGSEGAQLVRANKPLCCNESRCRDDGHSICEELQVTNCDHSSEQHLRTASGKQCQVVS